MNSTYGQEAFERVADARAHHLVLEYLKNATPAQQLYFVHRSNYDDNRRCLRWLVDQPQTDRAVILAIYWNLGADYFCQFASEADFEPDDYRLETWRFTRLIEQRYTSGFYPNASIYFNPYDTQGAYPGEYTGIERRYTTPPQMLETVQGAEYVDVDGETDAFDGYDDGLPEAVAEAMFALYDDEDDGDGDDGKK